MSGATGSGRMQKTVLAFLVAAGIGAGSLPGESGLLLARGNWEGLQRGLELGVFPSPRASEVGDSMIRVVRIDPHEFEFRLLSASASGQGQSLTAREWCRRNGMVAAINASMYQADHRTSVAFMKTRGHTNNHRLSKDKAILAFDRVKNNVPLIRIIDRQCEDFDGWKKKYRTFIQSIRMISCRGKNVWRQQPRKWSTALIGIDNKGRVLFIHVRSPYSTHDLINVLMALPLELSGAMYVEGGPAAQLYVGGSDRELEFVGSLEAGFNENDQIHLAWPVPNVIAISARTKAP